MTRTPSSMTGTEALSTIHTSVAAGADLPAHATGPSASAPSTASAATSSGGTSSATRPGGGTVETKTQVHGASFITLAVGVARADAGTRETDVVHAKETGFAVRVHLALTAKLHKLRGTASDGKGDDGDRRGSGARGPRHDRGFSHGEHTRTTPNAMGQDGGDEAIVDGGSGGDGEALALDGHAGAVRHSSPMLRSAYAVAAAVMLVSLLAATCNSGQELVPGCSICGTDADCDTGLLCWNWVCLTATTTPCTSDDQCSAPGNCDTLDGVWVWRGGWRWWSRRRRGRGRAGCRRGWGRWHRRGLASGGSGAPARDVEA